MPAKARDAYVEEIKKYDQFLNQNYPRSTPKKKFSGWGTNLSRVGAELSIKLCKQGGLTGIVLPASFFADEQTAALRSLVLQTGILEDVAYFPAEARLFGKADVSASTLVWRNTSPRRDLKTKITVYEKDLTKSSSDDLLIDRTSVDLSRFVIPISMGAQAIPLIRKMALTLPTWGDCEKADLWAGREVDETGKQNWLTDNATSSGPKFLKG